MSRQVVRCFLNEVNQVYHSAYQHTRKCSIIFDANLLKAY
ncbi:unnamed protein product, partial [Callosobruchus maculatus]